jgi:hypothetical protein
MLKKRTIIANHFEFTRIQLQKFVDQMKSSYRGRGSETWDLRPIRSDSHLDLRTFTNLMACTKSWTRQSTGGDSENFDNQRVQPTVMSDEGGATGKKSIVAARESVNEWNGCLDFTGILRSWYGWWQIRKQLTSWTKAKRLSRNWTNAGTL